MKREEVLVTGGTGYIGSHTVVELFQAGFEPIIVDNLSNSSVEILDGIEKIIGKRVLFEEVDCANMESMQLIVKKYPNLSYAIHIAAYKAVRESMEKPLEYYRNNLLSLINLLEILKENPRASIIFSSSCVVYGEPSIEHIPVTEDAPIKNPPSVYGKTKQMCEEILSDCASKPNSNLNSISLRYFNPIGAHPSAHIGELPRGTPQNLLTFITQTAAGIHKELKVFGNDYNTPDGSCIRDYIYVCDLAKAHVAALRALITKEERGTMDYFNVGTGKGLSVLELLQKFSHSTGVKIPYQIVSRREGDIEQVWANPTKANEMLGWSATTPIEEIMISAWRWEKKIRGIE